MKITVIAVGVFTGAMVLAQPMDNQANGLRDITQELNQATRQLEKDTNEQHKELRQDLDLAFKQLRKDNHSNIKQLRKDVDENIKRALDPSLTNNK
jgi:hypothetical protein